MKRIVRVAIPILLDCTQYDVKKKVIERFGKDIFHSIEYKDPGIEDILLAKMEQSEIIEKIQEDF